MAEVNKQVIKILLTDLSNVREGFALTMIQIDQLNMEIKGSEELIAFAINRV